MKAAKPQATPPDAMIHRADPAHRRRMLQILAGAIVLGALALAGLYGLLERLESRFSGGDVDGYYRWLSHLVAGVCSFFAVAAAAFGFWMRNIAAAAARDRRWPPMAMRTSSDVRIRFLTSADSLVTQIRAGAAALFVLAIMLLGWAAWLVLGR